MAQKALKTLASKNAATLNRTHLISSIVNLLFLLSAFTFRKHLTWWKYLVFNAPALIIEVWFERIARPSYKTDGDLKRAGEDLEAKGLTEWMWDVLYWTWGCVGLVALFGNWAWWLWIVVPSYSAWLAFSTYKGVKGGFGGMAAGGDGANGVASGGQSKRQAKMEKRGGGQKMVYR